MRRDRTGTLEPLGIGPIALIAALGILGASPQASREAPTSGDAAARVFAQFDNVPVGIAVSRDGRVFLAFSRAIDEYEPFSVAEDFTTTQIERGKAIRGKDERVRPFTVWSVKTNSRPLMLGKP
jgi:hypothetical protein